MGLLKRPIYFALLFLLLQFSCHFVSSFKILNADPASSWSPRRPIVDNDMKMPHQFHHPRHSNSLGARASFFPISSATTQPNAVRFNPTRAFPVAANSTAAVPLSVANDVPFPMPCRLPPDFWCDEPTVALTCTGGTLSFCEAYKRNRRGRKLNMKLAFETACPDSAGFVVNRLYPRVLNNKELASFVEVKAFPWGLAKRLSGQQIRCHHGPRECLGNRLTSCALNYYQWDRQGSERVLFCFMNHMMARGDPEQGMLDCLAQNWADQKLIREIMQCAHSVQVAAFQAEDERATEQILPRRRPRFVPFISLNSKSNIEMQAPLQLLLPEKIRHWNKTLAFDGEERWKFTKSLSPPSIFNSAAPSATAGQCDFPPEFWCSDPEITRACFNAQLCDQFQRTNFGHPVELRIIYNSQFDASRDYLFRVVRAQLLDPNVAPKFGENAGKVRVILEPAHLTRMALNECGLMLPNTNRNQNRRLGRGCARRIVEICIVNIVEPLEERNRHLLCLNALPENYEQQQFQITGADWATNCFHADSHRERILQCANSEAIWMGQNAHLATRQGQSALGPEPRRTDPWVLVNGYSLSTVQNYANVLDQMVCLWYRGPGHDRSQCGRCDYEPTHC